MTQLLMSGIANPKASPIIVQAQIVGLDFSTAAVSEYDQQDHQAKNRARCTDAGVGKSTENGSILESKNPLTPVKTKQTIIRATDSEFKAIFSYLKSIHPTQFKQYLSHPTNLNARNNIR